MKTTSPPSAGNIAQSPYGIGDHWITLDGARMRYLRSGSGPALVLVHGLLGYSFSWRYAIPALAEQATVHAVDMLGVGFSDRPRNLDCSLLASAERLLRFLDAAGIAECDLLGTSHGGAVTMRAAALAPGRFRTLTLVAPVNPWSSHGSWLAPILSNRAVAPVFMEILPRLKVSHRYFLRRLYGDPGKIRPGTLEGYLAPFSIDGTLNHGLGILRSWNSDIRELKSVLPKIANIPTLLMWGSVDPAVSAASAEALRRQFKNCRLVMFDGVGHLPYEEVPEEFNRVVSEFLSQHASI